MVFMPLLLWPYGKEVLDYRSVWWNQTSHLRARKQENEESAVYLKSFESTNLMT